MRGKRTIGTLQALKRKHGDLRISQLLNILENPKAGAPKKWGVHRISDLFLDVEVARSEKNSVRQATKALAKHYGASPATLQKRYTEGKDRFGDWPGLAEIIADRKKNAHSNGLIARLRMDSKKSWIKNWLLSVSHKPH